MTLKKQKYLLENLKTRKLKKTRIKNVDLKEIKECFQTTDDQKKNTIGKDQKSFRQNDWNNQKDKKIIKNLKQRRNKNCKKTI